MLTARGSSYWAVLGAVNLETRYATILVVLATAVMICVRVRRPTLHIAFMNP